MLSRAVALTGILLSLSACSLLPSGDEPLPAAGTDTTTLRTEPEVVDGWVIRDEPRSALGNPREYQVFGRTYRVMQQGGGHVETGLASWYGPDFHGAPTSSGEPYDMHALTAAHRHLPIPIFARVTHMDNGRSVVVRINDRGPFVGDERVIDLSYAAARRLGMVEQGLARVRIETLSHNLDTGETAAAEAGDRSRSGPEADHWHLQAAAFRERGNAERFLQQLIDGRLGDARIEPSDDQRLHRVWIGPLASRDDAERIRRRLVTQGLGPGHLIPPSWR